MLVRAKGIHSTRRGAQGLARGTVLAASLLVALTLGAQAQAQAQTQAQSQEKVRSLNEALAGAYMNNPTLRAARAGLRAVNEGVPQALSNWRPRVTVTGSAGAQRTDQSGGINSGTNGSTPIGAEISLTQPLYRGGRTTAGTAAAENDVLSERASLVSVEQGVLLDAVTAYMDVWRDQAVVELNVSNERVIRRQLEATQDRFTVGEVTRTDVAQAETRLATATAQRIASEGSLSTNKAVFQEVIGFEAEGLQAPDAVADLPAREVDAVNLAIAGNPDVLSASFAEKAAQNRVREVAGELLPNLQLRASASRRDDTARSDTRTDQGEILAELSVPIYQQGTVSSRVRQAKQVTSQRRVEIEQQRRRAEQVAISAWENLQTARAQIESFEAGVRSAEIALEGVRQENQVGARTILDILDAEQELLDAQVNLVRSRRDEVVAGFQILAATGRLTAQELGLPVTLHDPDRDYRKVRDSWFGLTAPGIE